MTEQPQPNLASVEANLFGVLVAFHKRTMTLRESSLGDEKLKVVADRIKTLLDDATAACPLPRPGQVKAFNHEA